MINFNPNIYVDNDTLAVNIFMKAGTESLNHTRDAKERLHVR